MLFFSIHLCPTSWSASSAAWLGKVASVLVTLIRSLENDLHNLVSVRSYVQGNVLHPEATASHSKGLPFTHFCVFCAVLSSLVLSPIVKCPELNFYPWGLPGLSSTLLTVTDWLDVQFSMGQTIVSKCARDSAAWQIDSLVWSLLIAAILFYFLICGYNMRIHNFVCPSPLYSHLLIFLSEFYKNLLLSSFSPSQVMTASMPDWSLFGLDDDTKLVLWAYTMKTIGWFHSLEL